MKRRLPAALAVALAASAIGSEDARALTVSPTFVDYGVNTTTAEQTKLYRADLTGLGLTQIGAITVEDSNSGIGGSPGAFSGFDLDAIFLDVDGDPYTLGDQSYASSFLFQVGTLRPGSAPASQTAGPTNGSASDTSVDEPFATLDAIDADFFEEGSISLGDGGVLTAVFAPEIVLGASLYLFVGEVSGDVGEELNAAITVSEQPPAIPVPATGLLLVTGLLAAAGVRRLGRT